MDTLTFPLRMQRHPSWFKSPDISNMNELKYLLLLEKTYKVMNTRKEWVPYKLTNHQQEWHLDDVAFKRHLAKHRLCVKSRNTSFTVSGLISSINAVPFFPNQVIPFVRLNDQRANDLIEDCKQLIQQINYTRLSDGSYYPFHPDSVNMDRSGSIKFEDQGVEFRAFPATASASEVIRGLRIAGSAGIVDESNFMRDFYNIYIALRDAASGSDEQGRSIYQMNIGTTLKGRTTPFNQWYEKISKITDGSIKLYKWPVFDPKKFDKSKPFIEQNLQPITQWHSLEVLQSKLNEDEHRFLEEYMAETTDSEEQFYPTGKVLMCVNNELRNYPTPPNPRGFYYMAIDVASLNDYFVITIFEKINGRFIQRHLTYERKVELDYMQSMCIKLIDLWNPVRVTPDANGMGFQLAQNLTKKYGSKIKSIKNQSIKGLTKGQTVRMTEFVHTNQKQMILCNQVELINDELQLRHYWMWNYEFDAESSAELGHGDIAIANGYALLPQNLKSARTSGRVIMNIKSPIDRIDVSKAVLPTVKW